MTAINSDGVIAQAAVWAVTARPTATAATRTDRTPRPTVVAAQITDPRLTFRILEDPSVG